MRRYLPMLAVAGLLLFGALIAGCATTPSANGTAAPTSVTTAVPTTGGGVQGTAIELMAENNRFDKSAITVPAGATVTLTLHNMDQGIPHNFAAYTDASASTTIYKGQVFNGVANMTYTFTAPSTRGTYFFRCDVHPVQMTGQFIVT